MRRVSILGTVAVLSVIYEGFFDVRNDVHGLGRYPPPFDRFRSLGALCPRRL